MGDLQIHDKIKVGYNALSAPKDGQKPTTTACPPPTPAGTYQSTTQISKATPLTLPDADEWSYAPAPRILAAELTKRLLSILVQDDPKITPEAAEAMARKWAPPVSCTLSFPWLRLLLTRVEPHADVRHLHVQARSAVESHVAWQYASAPEHVFRASRGPWAHPR